MLWQRLVWSWDVTTFLRRPEDVLKTSVSAGKRLRVKPTTCRSSHLRYFLRKVVLTNFAKLTGKHLCQSLFLNKVTGHRPAILFKKRLWHRSFPVNFAKFLRTPFWQNTSGQLLLNIHKAVLNLPVFPFTTLVWFRKYFEK